MDLKEVARSRGTNLKKLAIECDVAPSTLYAMANRSTCLSNAGIDIFMKISKALGISAEQLYAETRNDNDVWLTSGGSEKGFSDAVERELVSIYRSLTDQGKDQVMGFARGCLDAYRL